jgi:DNA mismatch endonuclease (patch repair protein)
MLETEFPIGTGHSGASMAKPINPATRSRMMAAIRSSGTCPEVAVRKALFARGLRYRVNDPRLPGRPDASFARYRAVVMVHGCFWHVHDCGAHQLPRTNPDFWAAKFAMNRARDARNVADLASRGWRVAVVWECAIDGRASLGIDAVADRLASWVRDDAPGATGVGTGMELRGELKTTRTVESKRRTFPAPAVGLPEAGDPRRVAEAPQEYGGSAAAGGAKSGFEAKPETKPS